MNSDAIKYNKLQYMKWKPTNSNTRYAITCNTIHEHAISIQYTQLKPNPTKSNTLKVVEYNKMQSNAMNIK